MSLILDALKKMEQDKARRQAKSVAIGPAILQEPTPVTPSWWKTPSLVAIAVVVTAISTAFIMNVPLPTGSTTRTATADTEKSTAVLPVIEPAAQPVPLPPTPAIAPSSPLPPQPAAPHSLPVSTPAPAPASTQDVTVTGIAWQEEPSARRAVINGILVAEGATVAGAQVKEIHADHVTFSSGGRTLTIFNSSPFR